MESVPLAVYLGCLVFIIGTYIQYFHIKLLKKFENVPKVFFFCSDAIVEEPFLVP